MGLKKTIRNKKGAEWTDMLLATVGMLAVAVVVIALALGIGYVGTGKTATSVCKTTIEAKNKWNAELNKGETKALESTQCSFWPDFRGNWCGNPIKIGTSVATVWGVSAIDKVARAKTDACIENIPDICPITIGRPATADAAAECVYRRAVDTYYTLQAGRGSSSEKRTNLDGRPFNLYELQVSVADLPEGAGWATVQGSCDKYLKTPAIMSETDLKNMNLKNCEAYIKNGRGYVCGYQESSDVCNVTFSRVTEATMTLTMVSRCQQEGSGPKQTVICKCFANPESGYSEFNGLPNDNIDFNSDDANYFQHFEKEGGATYTKLLDGLSHPEYSEFEGCGFVQDKSKINVGGQIVNGKLVGATGIPRENIKAGQLDILPGETTTYYTRLIDSDRDGIGEVRITTDRGYKEGEGEKKAEEKKRETNPIIGVAVARYKACPLCI